MATTVIFDWENGTVSNLAAEEFQTLIGICSNVTNDEVQYSSGAEATHKEFNLLTLFIGLLFVTLINMCAIVGIGVMRYLSKNVYNQVITLFVGLGVGSLSGSSFYHLLPMAHPNLKNSDVQSKNFITMAHFSLLGVYLFFMCDKLIKIVLEMRKRNRNTRDSCAHIDASHRSDSALLNGIENGSAEKNKICRAEAAELEMIQLESNAVKSMGDQAHGICVHDHSMTFQAGDSAIAAVAWMIIFGDGFHNFIDGISLGAAFSEGYHSGISVALAVLCEEFPHELGDVAILVASGMSLGQALLYNLLSAITCYIGYFIGIAVGEMEGTKYAYALAGGMFLYISLGCMMPEMKKAMEDALSVSLMNGLYVLALQSIGLMMGLFLMYNMALHGKSMEQFFHSHLESRV